MQRTSRRWLSAAAISWAIVFPTAGPGQTTPTAPSVPPPAPTVYSNPRAGSDDPRVGLKGGLYDAGEAAFGMEKIATLPKPPGFAPGETPTPAVTEPPPEQPGAP